MPQGRQTHVRDNVAKLTAQVIAITTLMGTTGIVVPAGASTEAQQIIQTALLSAANAILNNISNNTALGDTSVITSVAQNAASTTILAFNANRKSAVIVNDSDYILYLTYGNVVASATNYTWKLFPDAHIPVGDTTEQLNGIWSGAGAGLAMVTETT